MENLEKEVLKTRIWLKERFQDYYKGSKLAYMPENIHQREFGFGSFSKKIAVRHRGFKDEKDLQEYVRKEAPAHVNHSTARYRFPATEMADKEHLGTDLIFDIDVGDLNLPCSKEHGPNWVCETCFEALKKEIIKLKDFLMEDFGFGAGEMTINFSGSRGYHLRIQNGKVLSLDEKARKEITNYLSFEVDIGEFIKDIDGRIRGPLPGEGGLRGRIARTVINEISGDDRITEKKSVIEQIKEGNWGAFPRGYGLKRIGEYAKNSAVRIPVDSKVTTDLSHLIRLPETLHGGSGLLAKVVDDLDSFEPMGECFVFGAEETKVEIMNAVPEFMARGERTGPFDKGGRKVPLFIAVFLACKGFATINEKKAQSRPA
ncbi:MAG: DNA primase catalytic subunit PriS [Candidatus Altiarchaeota archaeon]|nr:DNA primase catalytic subunit PriS [Candidatus Altiarchaeota archaeon]